MAKRVNWLPNLRVDVDDLKQGTHGYITETVNEAFNRFLKDNYPRIAEGFRVEIADQSASPGTFTVYNGVGVDQDGQLLLNESDLNAQRSVTLNTDATHYIEVEFVTEESDTDARAFWDPEHDNGTDASGDVLPDGREITQSVATRIIQDWGIVSPISTTGFEVDLSPNSVKIPVAILTVSGGQIQESASPARSTIAQAASSTDTKVYLFNTRVFEDSGYTIDIGTGGTQETVTVNSNDRENGILTLSGGLANDHDIGERVVVSSATPPQFLNERTVHDPIVATSGGDARQRVYQGNEEVGYGLAQDPYNTPGNSDLQIKQLKDYVDFLAGQLRELKWGSARQSDIGNVAPPSSFPDPPHYYDQGTGVVNAKSHTISVGDGANSWGDFNTTRAGDAQLAIQGAIDALPADGGILYIKRGTYTITNTTIDIDKPVTIVGDGRDETLLETSGSAPVFTIDTFGGAPGQEFGGYFQIENVAVRLASGTTVDFAIDFDPSLGTRVIAKGCQFHGIRTTGAGEIEDSVFESCDFRGDTESSVGHAFSGDVIESSFVNCNFHSALTVSGARAVNLTSGSDNVEFRDCRFTATTSSSDVVEIDTVTNLRFAGCKFSFGIDQDALAISGSSQHVAINSCFFEQTSTNGSSDSGGVSFEGNSVDVIIKGCSFVGVDSSVFIQSAQSVTRLVIDSCSCIGVAVTSGKRFLNIVGDLTDGIVSSCVISGLEEPNTGDLDGILIGGSSTVLGLKISNVSFKDCGDSSNNSGVRFVHKEIGASVEALNISNCLVDNIDSSGTLIGVALSGSSPGETVDASINNCVFSNYGASGTNVGAVRVAGVDNAVIEGNLVAALGDEGVSINLNAFQLSQAVRVVISNNTIRTLKSASSFSAVEIIGVIEGVTISGNVIEGIGGTFIGTFRPINIDSPLDSEDLFLLNIVGNVLYGEMLSGISISLSDDAVDVEGRVIVSNNSISNFTGVAINMSGVLGNNENFIISGNQLFSLDAACGGILVTDLQNVVIQGNSVTLHSSSSGQKRGIYITATSASAENHVLSGNVVKVLNGTNTSFGIAAGANTTNTVCNGNVFTGDTDFPAIETAGSSGYIVGNHVVQNGAGLAIADTGGTSKHAQNSDGTADITVDDTGAALINLNIEN